MNLKFLLLVVCMLSSVLAIAESPANKLIELDLVNSYQRILDCRFNESKRKWDSLEVENARFLKSMLFYTANYPATLTYRFDSLQRAGVAISTSDDGAFRIYSWDTWTGGTAHMFYSVFQYTDSGKLYSTCLCDTANLDNGMGSNLHSDIYTAKAESETYYLALSHGIYSTKDVAQFITAYVIKEGRLEVAHIVDVEAGEYEGISINFNFFDVVDRPERPVRLIKYDKDRQWLFVPINNGDEVVAYNQFYVYRFTGEYFEPVKCLADVSRGDTANWYIHGKDYMYYCDEPVYVSGDVFYTVISTRGSNGGFSEFWMITFSSTTTKVLDSVFLYSDIDHGLGPINWHEHEYANDNGVRVIWQRNGNKVNEIPDEGEDPNIIQSVTLYTVSVDGKITSKPQPRQDK